MKKRFLILSLFCIFSASLYAENCSVDLSKVDCSSQKEALKKCEGKNNYNDMKSKVERHCSSLGQVSSASDCGTEINSSHGAKASGTGGFGADDPGAAGTTNK